MRALKTTLAALFLVSPLLAQAPLSPSTGAPRDDAQFLRALGDSAGQEAVESRVLFIRLTPEQAAKQPRVLEVRVAVDGRPFVEERLSLEPGQAKASDFELLARDPETLDRLYTLSKNAAHRIVVTVIADGETVRELSFRDLVRSNRALKRGKLQPQAAKSEVRVFIPKVSPPGSQERTALNKGLQPDPDCEAQCDEQAQLCYYDYCDQRGDCSYCWDDYEYCVDRCPTVCSDPKNVREFTQTQLVSYGWTGYSQCMEDIFENDFQDGELYDEYQYTYKNTRIRRTEYCNGTYSDEVLSVSYSYAYCNRRTFLTCFNPWTWAYNIC